MVGGSPGAKTGSMATLPAVRVLVADDHEIVRNAVADLLGQVPDVEVVGVAGNGREAVSMAAARHPRVVVMDVEMPCVGGLEATREILASAPDTKVLMLTAFPDQERAASAMRAGAVAYLLKENDAHDLIDAILAAVFATW
jgi:DNA-binding NarL/FixJ family response regulator